MGNGEWGMGDGEWGMGDAEWGMASGGGSSSRAACGATIHIMPKASAIKQMI